MKGNLIRVYRKSNKMTIKELAAKSGVSEISIRSYENNKRNPKYENLEKIAYVLGIPVSEILGYKLQGQCDNLRALSLGERIRTIRKNKKITLKELADKINVSTPTVSRYESNKREPNYETLLLIAEALEVPVSELLNEECEENNELLRLIIDKKNLDVEVDIKEDYLFKLDEEEIEEINNKAKEIFRILLKGLL